MTGNLASVVKEETVKMLANIGNVAIDFQDGDDIMDDVLDVPDLPAGRKTLDRELLHAHTVWDGVPDPVLRATCVGRPRNDLPPYIPRPFYDFFATQKLSKVSAFLARAHRMCGVETPVLTGWEVTTSRKSCSVSLTEGAVQICTFAVRPNRQMDPYQKGRSTDDCRRPTNGDVPTFWS
jgi:hypothetical protein